MRLESDESTILLIHTYTLFAFAWEVGATFYLPICGIRNVED